MSNTEASSSNNTHPNHVAADDDMELVVVEGSTTPVPEPASPGAHTTSAISNESFTNKSFGHLNLSVGWDKLTFTIEGKEILKSLTGAALPNRCLAIMGSSGAGKTTFLNAISDRLEVNAKKVISGDRILNGVQYQSKYRRAIGFVTQDDILSPTANPYEALAFSVRVRNGSSAEETEERVERCLEELNLVEARNTIVGIPGIIAGLSGGERKRTNIGVELITEPKILLLDEPTSGLDSITSTKVVSLLQTLARKGRTVVFTIHQPPADALEFFDDFMLMAAGEIVFHGPMDEAVDYFASLGYPCPDTHTPTDYFMTLVQNEELAPQLIDEWKKLISDTASAAKYKEYLSPVPPSCLGTEESTKKLLDDETKNPGASLGIQAIELFRRSWRGVIRNRMLIGATMVQSIVFAAVISIIFRNIPANQVGVADRTGALFVLVTNMAFSSVMGVVNSFAPEKAVYIREQQGNIYSPFLYFLAKSISEFPVNAVAVMCQCIICYWSFGLVATASNFFIFYAIMIMLQQVGQGIGLAAASLIDNYVILTGIVPMIILPMMMAGGFLASTDRVRPAWIWLEKISFLRHGNILLLKNEFLDLDHISCDVGKYGASFCSRQPQNGTAVLENYDLMGNQDQEWIMWLCLGLFFLLSRCLAVLGFYRIAGRKN